MTPTCGVTKKPALPLSGLAWQPPHVLSLALTLIVSQRPALPPMTLSRGSRFDTVSLDVTAEGAVTRQQRTDYSVAPVRGALTETEHLELSKLSGQLTPFTAAPLPAGPMNASRLIITVGSNTVTVADLEALPPSWRALVQVLQGVEKRLLRPAPKKR